uniref:RAP domain-containing protein n=1 Tax=Neospora caninum (strain Liverpool) TaxID=572307 RepID=A0A0F7U653_NEOCL|nr:TPA: hypothetical protein BN1204_000580 [Neospora caninum Liverpool]
MQMDQLLMQSDSAEEVLTLLVSHRGVLFLHNLVTALQLLADFANDGPCTTRLSQRGRTGGPAELRGDALSQSTGDAQPGVVETTARKPSGSNTGAEAVSDTCETRSETRPTAEGFEQLFPHFQVGQPLPSGWPKPTSAYQTVTGVSTTSAKGLVTVGSAFSEERSEGGSVMHGLGVADWIVRDERYEVLLQDLRFHRRSLSFDAAATVVLSLRRLNHRHYPVLSAMLHPLARREIHLPSYWTSSFATDVDRLERGRSGTLPARPTVTEESLESRQRIEKILHQRLDTLFQCADVYVWAGYIQHPFFDRVAALFFSALQQMRGSPSNGATPCTSPSLPGESHSAGSGSGTTGSAKGLSPRETPPPPTLTMHLQEGVQEGPDPVQPIASALHCGSVAAGNTQTAPEGWCNADTGTPQTGASTSTAAVTPRVSPISQKALFKKTSPQSGLMTSTVSGRLGASPSLLVRALQVFSSLRVNAGHEVFIAAAERIMQYLTDLKPDQLVAVAAAVSKQGGCGVLFPTSRGQMQPTSLPNQYFLPSDKELLGDTKARIRPEEAKIARDESLTRWTQKHGASGDSALWDSPGSTDSTSPPSSVCRPTQLLCRNTTPGSDTSLRASFRGNLAREASVNVDDHSAAIISPLQSIPDSVLTAVASRFEVASSAFSLSSIVTLLTAFKSRSLHFPTCISLAISRVTPHLRVAANVRHRATLTVEEIGDLLESCTFFGDRTPRKSDRPGETTAEITSGHLRIVEDVNSKSELMDAAAAYLEQHLDEISERTAMQVTFALAAVEGATSRHAYLLSFVFRKMGKGTEWQRNKVRVFQLWLSQVLQFPWLHYNMPQRCVFEGLRAWCMQRGGYGAPFPREVAELSEMLTRLGVEHKAFVQVPGSPYELDILLRSRGAQHTVIMVTNECAPNTFAPVGGSRLQEAHLALAGYSQILFLHQPTWNSLRSEECRVRFVAILLQRLCRGLHLAVDGTAFERATAEAQDTRNVVAADKKLASSDDGKICS